LKTNWLRADTTVVEANVEYPSDSSLLAKGVVRMAGSVERIKRAGLACGRGSLIGAARCIGGLARVKQRTGKPPRAVPADRGYGDATVENGLRELGVRYVALPTKGKPSRRPHGVRDPQGLRCCRGRRARR
jgi:IS5 family transposase